MFTQEPVLTFPSGLIPPGEIAISNALDKWIPALGFSCGLDGLTAGMIAGRLIYHHRKQQRLSQSSSYLPVIMIFIESASLSFISKILQISTSSPVLVSNPIVVPLCVCPVSISFITFAPLNMVHRPSRRISSFSGRCWGRMSAKRWQGIDIGYLHFASRYPNRDEQPQTITILPAYLILS